MAGQQAILKFLNNQQAVGQLQQQNVFQAVKNAQGQQRIDQAHQRLIQGQQRINNAQAAQQQRAGQAQQRLDQQAQAQQQRGLFGAIRAGQNQQREQRLQQGQTIGAVQSTLSATDRLRGVGDRFEAWAESVPTPGGIGILLLLIFLFLWAIVPVNGKRTRAELLWLTLMGQTTMADAPEGGTTSGGTGSGGIGSGGPEVPMSNPLFGTLPIRDFGGVY